MAQFLNVEENMTLQYLGNRLKEVKKVYDDCQRYNDVLIEPTEDILGPFVKDGFPDPSSWFNTKCTNQSWHTDCVGNPFYKGAIITSYPNTTYIFLTDEEIDMKAWNKSIFINNELLINKMVEEKRGRIFIPNPGDVYYMDKSIIHKSNPLSVGNPHLCMRITLYTDANWRKKIYESKQTA
jgi:hypothetical protein